MDMALPHEVPRFVGLTLNRDATHGLAGLFGKGTGGTDQHHGSDSTRLLGGQVQKDIASSASQRFGGDGSGFVPHTVTRGQVTRKSGCCISSRARSQTAS